MIRKISLLAAVLALAAASAVHAQGEKKAAKITGFLIDNMCAAPSDKDAKAHAVSCAKMAACEKSGFAVVAGEKTYKLDEQGNKLAAEALKAAKTKKGLKVDVEGTLEGDTLHAATLAEAK